MSAYDLPAPGMARYTLRHNGRTGWMILDPNGRALPGTFRTRDQAESKLAEIQLAADRAAGRILRPCLCCGQEFKSGGRGNRMCTRCRLGAAGEALNSPYELGSRR